MPTHCSTLLCSFSAHRLPAYISPVRLLESLRFQTGSERIPCHFEKVAGSSVEFLWRLLRDLFKLSLDVGVDPAVLPTTVSFHCVMSSDSIELLCSMAPGFYPEAERALISRGLCAALPLVKTIMYVRVA